MAAFTDVDGVPMHAHRRLLREVLKDEWGFDGVVVADWDGLGQLVNQGVATDLRDAAAQAIAAGVDIDMVSGAYAAHLAELVEAGQVPLKLVDDAARRVIRLKMRQGLFEHPYVGAFTSAAETASVPGTTSVPEPGSRSGEANSVASIGLPAGQLEVLRAMAAIGKPLVVVVFTGRPLDLADAVLIAWHPGVEAGPALIDTLFGDRSPGGRLPMTFPRSVGHLPSSSLARPTGRPIDAADDPVMGRYLDALVVPPLPFGSGLTYTTFSYGPLRLSAHEMPLHGGSIEVSVDVTNSGNRAGREVVQLYLRDLVADVTRPLRELADWVSLVLDAGSIGTATFTVTPAQLS